MMWTAEKDTLLEQRLRAGATAREVSEELGTTRNAVLGRAFRLKLAIDRPRREPKPKPKVFTERTACRRSPVRIADRAQTAKQIAELREQGWTWRAIGQFFNMDALTSRTIAKEFGLYVMVNPMKRFTAGETAYICEAWANGTHTQIIAEKLGRSEGVIRQQVRRLQHKGLCSTRDPIKTRIIRQYGEHALNAGETPAEALQVINKAKADAFNFARQKELEANKKRRTLAIEAMLAKIASGHERDAAIFEARSSGAHLQEIADEVDLTRERVRQICFGHAEKIALARVLP